MNITDEDSLTPNEFDKMHKAEIQKYKDKQPIFSRQDMLSFAEFSYKRGNKMKSARRDDLKVWEKTRSF